MNTVPRNLRMRGQNRFRRFQRSVPDRRLNKSRHWIRQRRSLAVDHFNAFRKFWPALKAMFARDHQLRVGQCKFADIKSQRKHMRMFCKLFKTWMVSFNAANRLHIGGAIGFQQFFGLFFVLFQAGTGGQRLGLHQRPSFHGYAC